MHTAVAEIEAAGGSALGIVGDVRDEEAVARAVAACVDRFGGIDACVNNASAIALQGVLELPLKRYDLMQDINVRGTYVVCRTCLPHLLASDNPHVLTLSPPAEPRPVLVRRARRLHDGEVRHESLRARCRRGVP